jgi:hypothetical protein
MFSRLIGLFGKILFWGFIALVISIITLGGYFFYKSGQPMQVAAAQRLAPGITYQEFWQDRIQQWNKIDDQHEAQGKGRGCITSGYIMVSTWIFPGSFINVTRVHNNPNTPLAKSIIISVKGIMPPDDLLYGPWWKLPNAWWWEIENMSWYFFYRPSARAVYCEVGAPYRPALSQTDNQ